MVDVTVRYKYRNRSQVKLRKQIANTLGIGRCINNNCRSTSIRSYHIRICLKVPQRNRFNQESHPAKIDTRGTMLGQSSSVLPRLVVWGRSSSDDQTIRVVDAVDVSQAGEDSLKGLFVGEFNLVAEKGDSVTAGDGRGCVDVGTRV